MSRAAAYQMRRSEKTAEQMIAKRLQNISLQLGEWIEICVENGIAKLTGRVLSAEMKQLAGRLTKGHDAIVKCHNCIEIMKSWPHSQGFQFAVSWKDNNGLREEDDGGGIYELAA